MSGSSFALTLIRNHEKKPSMRCASRDVPCDVPWRMPVTNPIELKPWFGGRPVCHATAARAHDDWVWLSLLSPSRQRVFRFTSKAATKRPNGGVFSSPKGTIFMASSHNISSPLGNPLGLAFYWQPLRPAADLAASLLSQEISCVPRNRVKAALRTKK